MVNPGRLRRRRRRVNFGQQKVCCLLLFSRLSLHRRAGVYFVVVSSLSTFREQFFYFTYRRPKEQSFLSSHTRPAGRTCPWHRKDCRSVSAAALSQSFPVHQQPEASCCGAVRRNRCSARQFAIQRHPDIGFNCVRLMLPRQFECRHGIFGCVIRSAPMSNNKWYRR